MQLDFVIVFLLSSAISPMTIILPSAGVYVFTLQGYSGGQAVEGLSRTETLYFFGEEGGVCTARG